MLLPGSFATLGTLQSVLLQIPELGLLALAQMLVVVTRGIDLSAASSLALSGMLAAMLVAGAREEVAALLALGLPAEVPVMKALAVPQLAAHLAGRCSSDDAMAQALIVTRQYQKRQQTWARNQFPDWSRV